MAGQSTLQSKEEPQVWTVTQLTRRVKTALETSLGRLWVSGEVSNFRVSPAGHAYFTLKDEQSQLAAVMFKGRLARLKFEPESGLDVIAHGQITVYEQRGQYQIICEDLQPKGVGALQLAFEKLKKKLQAEGLFDEALKKPLPLLPRRIGIVTSPTGAAIRDILNVIERRFAGVHLLIYPARVQGDEAAAEIAEGIETLDEFGVDVMIIGRGGGSLEDLWPFNEEVVVRAVYEASTPIISAVGHEIDFSLSDFAADLRAPTPSAAAELVVQEYEGLVQRIAAARERLVRATSRQLESMRSRLSLAQSSYVFQRPEEMIRQRRQRIDELRMALEHDLKGELRSVRHRLGQATAALRLLSPARTAQHSRERLDGLRKRLYQSGEGQLARHRNRFLPVIARLEALSPLAILSRGYAAAWKLPEEILVRDATQLNSRDKVRIRFGKGSVTAAVEEISDES